MKYERFALRNAIIYFINNSMLFKRNEIKKQDENIIHAFLFSENLVFNIPIKIFTKYNIKIKMSIFFTPNFLYKSILIHPARVTYYLRHNMKNILHKDIV